MNPDSDDCDACLFDGHYCPTCKDVVGHWHTHDDEGDLSDDR